MLYSYQATTTFLGLDFASLPSLLLPVEVAIRHDYFHHFFCRSPCDLLTLYTMSELDSFHHNCTSLAWQDIWLVCSIVQFPFRFGTLLTGCTLDRRERHSCGNNLLLCFVWLCQPGCDIERWGMLVPSSSAVYAISSISQRDDTATAWDSSTTLWQRTAHTIVQFVSP